MSFRGQLIKLGFQMTGPSLSLWQDAARFAVGGNLVDGVRMSIGSSGNKISMDSANDRGLQIYTTQSVESGTAMAAEINYTQTGASYTLKIEALRASVASAVMTGDWCNAIVGVITYTAPGTAGGGIAAAICAEINLPSQQLGGGAYALFHGYLGLSSATVLEDSTTHVVTFLRLEAGGTVGSFDDYGYLFHVTGLTAAADDLLSLTSHTLKVNLEGNERFALMGSQLQDGLGLGVTGSAMDLPAYTDRAVAIFTTSDVTTEGTVTPFQLESRTTGHKANSQVMYVHAYHTNYAGNENTVGHFYSQWTAGSQGPLGMASAVTAKMELPTACMGAFFAFYGKMNFTGDPVLTDPAVGYGNSAGFLLLSVGEDSSGITNFSQYGRFIEVHNIEVAAGYMCSLTSQTLRCAIPDASTIRYLVLSQMEDGLGLGNTTTSMSLTSATTKAIDVYTTTSVVTDTDMTGMYLEYTRTASVTADGRDRGIWVRMEAGNYRWYTMTGVYSTIEIGSGGCLGRASAIQGELILDNVATSSGAYSAINAEIGYAGSTSNGLPGPVSYISCIFTGTETNFVANAYLMEIDGGTAGNSNIISANSQTARCIIGEYGSGAARYMVFSQAADCLSLTTTATPIVLAAGSTTTTAIGISGTMSGVAARVFQARPTINVGVMGDGYGSHEVDITLTGQVAGHVAASSSWLSITGTAAVGGYHCARTDGIYTTGTLTDSVLIFGARMQAQLSNTGWHRLCPFSLETGARTIDAVFMVGSPGGEIGWTAGVSSIGTQSGSVPFMIDTNGTVYYIALYDAVAS